jgi:ATP-dependent exoDNAse (exonuclease V) beta subunit
MSAPLADQAARDRIRNDLDTTLVVEAAAGTGKTTALVGRMVSALMTGRAHLDRMVAVTFTEPAAGELKLRLRTEIERARRHPDCDPEARDGLTAALPQLEAARIGTIHAFCAELLRERPVEAGVDPQFQVAPEEVAGPLFDRVFDRWFEAQLDRPGEGVRRVLRQRARGDDGPREKLRAAAWELAAWRDFPARWRHTPFARDGEIDAVLAELAVLAAGAAGGDANDWFFKSLREIHRFMDDVQRREAAAPRDYDGLEAELTTFSRAKHWRWRGWRPRQGETAKVALIERRNALKERLDGFVADAGADLAPRLRDELWPVVEGYERLKRRAGCLDFLDLLLKARDLVRNDAVTREELQQRYAHVFVDEFQDTDPLQAELLLLLAADDPAESDWRRVRPVPGKLFVVGDPKQSIYRFRRADVALYTDVKRRLEAAGAAVVDLTVSFRAVPAIQQAVNAAFAPAMEIGEGTQARYVPLSPARPPLGDQPAVVALPVPKPYGDFGTVVNWRIEESLPDAIAAFVHWLVRQSGWTVTERERPDVPVPVQPRHVCILFRRMRSWGRDVTRDYVRALEARQMRHVLVGGSSFHAREEVCALRNALGAIERPDDDLALFAVLRGPLFALGDGALLAWRERFRSLHPFRTLPADLPPHLVEVADALAVLRDLHRHRNRRPVADTIARLLAAVRAQAGLAIWPTGEQALANVGRLMDLARRAERHGLTSFRAFVDRLERDAASGEAGEAPILEDGSEGVRIMTVHRAKGLEFPVVILADLTANATPMEPNRHVDPARGLAAMRLAGAMPPELADHREHELAREREEAVRLLYVAATRARDLLVVPAVSDQEQEGWLDTLHPAIYPEPLHARLPETTQPPACPPLTGDCVIARPEEVLRPDVAVAPGRHRPRAGAHRVVWWAPEALELDVEENVGLKQQRLLTADDEQVRSQDGVRAHEAWQAERRRVRAAGGTASVRVVTATEHAEATTGEPDVATARVGFAGARPHGRRFGTLVHAMLATVPLTADDVVLQAAAEIEGRALAAPDDEVAAAIDVVRAILAHPLLRRAASAAECRRETPVLLRLDDGTLVEGIVDAAFRDDDGWTVVDWKTDLGLGAEREGQYQRQVALYVDAVARATGAPARGVLLRV